jgi:hypothetical protein
MKLETYLAKQGYITYVSEGDDVFEGEDGQRNIEIYESRDDIEPIGWFVSLPGRAELEWRNIFGKVTTGTMFTEAEAKAAAKAHKFYPITSK